MLRKLAAAWCSCYLLPLGVSFCSLHKDSFHVSLTKDESAVEEVLAWKFRLNNPAKYVLHGPSVFHLNETTDRSVFNKLQKEKTKVTNASRDILKLPRA